MLPLGVGIVRVLTAFSGYAASSDNAANELTVRDIGTRMVLLGPFSRHGWSHPGPAFAYLMAIPYRIFGSDSAAMLVGALLVNAVAIAAIVLVARRWGGLTLAVPVTLGMTVLTVTLPRDFLQDPWNPFVTVLPFGAFSCSSWASTLGDRWALPVACAVGTFCVQTHIGYAAPVAVLLVGAIGKAVHDRDLPRVGGDGRRGLTMLGIAAAVLAVMWLPPVYDEIAHAHGNLTAITEYFRDAGQPPQGIRSAARSSEHSSRSHRTGCSDCVASTPSRVSPRRCGQTPIPVLLVAFAAAGVVAFRRHYVELRAAVVVLAVTILVGAGAVAQIIGTMTEYRLRWLWVLAVLTVGVTVAVALRRTAESSVRAGPRPHQLPRDRHRRAHDVRRGPGRRRRPARGAARRRGRGRRAPARRPPPRRTRTDPVARRVVRAGSRT